eukprot:112527_1
MGAVISFGKRCVPKLLFSNMMLINDSLQATVQLFNGSIQFIVKKTATHKLICPFQIDMCIAVGAPAIIENNVTAGGDSDNDDDDDGDYYGDYYEFYDDDDDDIGGDGVDDGLSGDFVDCIGAIEDKLKNNNLKYAFCPATKNRNRMFNEVYEEFVKKVPHELEGLDDKTEYLHKKRLIAFVDRREEKHDEEKDEEFNIFMYEPPKDCRDMPKTSMVPEWCISASRTCLLPNM